MKREKGRTYKTWMEFEAIYEKNKIEGDYLEDGYIDEQEATIWYNSAKCKLGAWFKETEEYRVY